MPEIRWRGVVAGHEAHVARYRSRSAYPWHAHDTDQACLILQGRLVARFGGRSVLCIPGDVLFHQAGSPHSEEHLDEECVALSIRSLGRSRDVTGSPRSIAVPRHSGGVTVAAARRWRAGYGREDDLAEGAASSALLALDGFMAEPAVWKIPEDGPEYRVLRMLPIHPALTLSRAAAAVGVSRTVLAERFRRAFGCTVGAYVLGARLARAVDALKRSGMALAQVAMRSGYADQPHMTRHFRRLLGVTPGTVRQRGRLD